MQGKYEVRSSSWEREYPGNIRGYANRHADYRKREQPGAVPAKPVGQASEGDGDRGATMAATTVCAVPSPY